MGDVLLPLKAKGEGGGCFASTEGSSRDTPPSIATTIGTLSITSL